MGDLYVVELDGLPLPGRVSLTLAAAKREAMAVKCLRRGSVVKVAVVLYSDAPERRGRKWEI